MKEIIKSFTYGEDIQEKTAVKFSQEGVVVKAASAADNVCGITLFTGRQGAKGDVLMFGLGLVSTTGAVRTGDMLVSGSNGRLIKFEPENHEGKVTVVAQVLETATSAANLSAFVNPHVVILPVEEEEEETVSDGQE